MESLFKLSNFNEQELRKIFASQGELLDQAIENPAMTDNQAFIHFILNYLADLDLTENEARNHFNNIRNHQAELSKSLQRDVGFRVAMLDYFYNLSSIIKNPRLVEVDAYEEIVKMTKEDPKTGCYNPQFLSEIADKEMKRAKRYRQKFSLVLIDIDDFKKINDSHGHLFGDRILKKFAHILKESVRQEDAVGRFGGDEFIIIIPQTGRVGARFLAERIREKLVEELQNIDYNGKNISVTFSAGIPTSPMDAEDYEGMIRSADKALYKSKKLGKNRIFDYLEGENYQDLDNPEERRKYSRCSVDPENEVDLLSEEDSAVVHGKLLNMSPSGVLLECFAELDNNLIKDSNDLQIKKIGSFKIPDLNLKANVTRFQSEQQNLKFYLGLEFHKSMDQDQWKNIEKICKEITIE